MVKKPVTIGPHRFDNNSDGVMEKHFCRQL